MAPHGAAQFVPDPAIHFLKWPFALAELEVTCPASRYRVYPLDGVRHLVAPRFAQQLCEPGAQATQAHRCHPQPRLLMPAHPIAQIVTLPGSRDSTLLLIHRQFQTLIQEALDTGQ